MDYSQLMSQLETLSRVGEGIKVRKVLSELNISRIPRPYKLGFANIARRNHQAFLALRILNTTVLARNPLSEPPTTEEIAEYSVSLLNIGATREAKNLLRDLNDQEFNQVLLYRSFVAFTEWNYAEAVPWLKKFIRQERDEYQKVIGQVNLAAALNFTGDFNRSQRLLKIILSSTEKHGYHLLRGNALELSALAAIGLKDYGLAKEYLSFAANHLKNVRNLTDFYVKKWGVILSLYKRVSNQSLEELSRLKREALVLRNWESCRELDYFKSLFTKDQTLFTHVFFGTPYPAYRKKMLEEKWTNWCLPTEYIYKSEVVVEEEREVFDLAIGQCDSKEIFLEPGQLMHNCLILLVSDFYRPRALGSLFSELFPDEVFNPNSSPDRIYQLIRRLRVWIKKNRLPISLLESQGFYSIELKGNLALRVPEEIKLASKESVLMEKLVSHFGKKAFTAADASRLLNLSRTSLQRFLTWAQLRKCIEKQGSGPKLYYKIL
ncbi:MAG: hypothetical protein KDD61_07550 [Bdellovibrionales bacterium]|nr:hypothetical protein [Bdellovibrionales bacterium]